MTKKRNEHNDSWIKVVTIMTIVGLIALGALAMYYFMLQKTGVNPVMVMQPTRPFMPYNAPQYNDYVYGRFNQRIPNPKKLRTVTACSIAPNKVGCLKTQIEVPLEVVRHKPGYVRPKTRRAHMRDRIDRLERNVTLLKKTQSQEQALKELQKRVAALQNNMS
jgi:hypothetical protein